MAGRDKTTLKGFPVSLGHSIMTTKFLQGGKLKIQLLGAMLK